MSDTSPSRVPRLRPAVMDARERLKLGRARCREQHDGGAPGSDVSARLTELLDAIVLDLYEASLAELESRGVECDVALVAHGGYGRRDVAPYSDVDLMLLCDPAAHVAAAELAKHLSRNICDAGLSLGFSLRRPAEACSLAVKDAQILTSLAESRFLAGNRRLFDTFQQRLARATRRRRRWLINAIVDARQAERHQYGETAYLLEPNIKRSRGGLRDLQFIRWIGFARYGCSDLTRLCQLGILTHLDHQRLTRAHEFLLRIRNEMHFQAAKSQDVVTRDEQVRLARRFGYRDLSSLLPVERFMRDYFEHTGEIRYVSANFLASARIRSRFIAAIAALFSHRVEGDFLIGPVHIRATRRGLEKVRSHLADVLRLMELANLYDKRIDHGTWEAIRQAMSQRSSEKISSAATSRFLSLLSQPGRLAALLRRLHELRALEQILPAMHHARHLMQFNDYHKYTVDEHCIRAVEQATEFLTDPRPIGATYRELRDKRLLHLALLIHDLGKGYDDDHSEVGGLIAAEVAQRLQLSEQEADTLKFLVSRHLLMTHLALREDMLDDSVVLRLAREVGSPEVLQMLYIHSCADLSAVGPKVLNEWKLDLLTELYYRTFRHLTGDDVSQAAAREMRHRRSAVQSQVPPAHRDTWWERQIEALPTGYLLTVPPQQIHAALSRLHDLATDQVTAWHRYSSERKVSIYLVGTYESITPGIFHKLTGALTGKGLQILSAEIHTLADGLVLDRFFVEDTDYDGEPPVERTREVCEALIASLTTRAEQPPAFRRLWKSEKSVTAAKFAEMPTRIRFDDATADRHTIITIFTYDRRGLLYSISRTLFECGLVVHMAKIATYLDQVVDAFYVTDQKGSKIFDQQLRSEIRRRLTEALEPPTSP